MQANPWQALILAFLLGILAESILLRLPNRIMRHWNIRKHGWPPAHCDADGDFKKDESND